MGTVFVIEHTAYEKLMKIKTNVKSMKNHIFKQYNVKLMEIPPNDVRKKGAKKSMNPCAFFYINTNKNRKRYI